MQVWWFSTHSVIMLNIDFNCIFITITILLNFNINSIKFNKRKKIFHGEWKDYKKNKHNYF